MYLKFTIIFIVKIIKYFNRFKIIKVSFKAI
jgi:hypothetical protein